MKACLHILLFFFLMATPHAIQAQCPMGSAVQDSLALVDLYNQAGGTGWASKTSWLAKGVHFGDWAGVDTQNGRVTSLSISKANGVLPASFSNLTEIQSLSLTSSTFSNALDIACKEKLVSLNVTSSSFNGYHSGETLFLFLDVINIGSSSWGGVTTSIDISKMPNLKSITGGGIYNVGKLITNPSEGYYGKLTSIVLGDGGSYKSSFTAGAGLDIRGMGMLETLYLNSTNFSFLECGNTVFPHIKELTLWFSNLSQKEIDVRGMPNLEVISTNNATLGGFNTGTTFYPNLSVLNFHGTNNISEYTHITRALVIDISRMPSLSVFATQGTRMGGLITNPTKGYYSKLKTINIGLDWPDYTYTLSGPLSIVGMGNLETLIMPYTRFTGLETGDTEYPYLKKLYLNGADLSNRILDLGRMPNLVELNIANTNLKGLDLGEGIFSALKEFTCYNIKWKDIFDGDLDVSNMSALTILNASNSSFDRIVSNNDLNSLSLQNNKLTFSSIIPFINRATTYTYSPQAKVGTAKTVYLPAILSVEVDQEMDVSSTDALTDNVYTWYSSTGTVVKSATSGQAGRSFTPTAKGTYYYTITNPSAPNLTLTSENITVLSELVAYYPFNGNASDQSGNGLNGTVTGAVYAGNQTCQGVQGYTFDASNGSDFISINSNSSFNLSNQISILAWVRPISVNGTGACYNDAFIKKGALTLNSSFSFAYSFRESAGCNSGKSEKGVLGAYIVGIDGTKFSIKTASLLELNKDYFVALTYNAGVASIYVNGQLQKQEQVADFQIGYNNSPLIIGASDDPFHKQNIDEVKIYTRALSAEELQQAYMDNTFSVPQKPSILVDATNLQSTGNYLFVAQGAITAAEKWQWYKDGLPIAGQNANELTVNASLQGKYQVGIENTNVPACISLSDKQYISCGFILSRQTDSLALVDLYNQAGGAGWSLKENWLVENMPINTWQGVGLTDGRVTSLTCANAAGVVPSTFSKLNMIENLTLQGQFSNSLDISCMSNLANFDVSGSTFENILVGSTEFTKLDRLFTFSLTLSETAILDISGMPYLSSLWLNVSLGGVKTNPQQGYYSRLTSFYCFSMDFEGSIDMRGMGNLSRIHAVWNNFDGFIFGTTPYNQLSSLDIRVSTFPNMIMDISNMPNLEYVHLAAMQIKGFVTGNTAFNKMKSFGINSKFAQDVTIDIRQMPNLVTFVCSAAQTGGRLQVTSNGAANAYPFLTTFSLSWATGEVNISGMPALQTVYLASCQTSALEEGTTIFPQLSSLEIWSSDLSDDINISGMPNLSRIWLFDVTATTFKTDNTITYNQLSNIMFWGGYGTTFNQLDFNISNMPALEYVYLGRILGIKSIITNPSVGYYPLLSNLDIFPNVFVPNYGFPPITLDVRGMGNLHNLAIPYCNIQELTTGTTTFNNLWQLDIYNNQLESIDLSKMPLLQRLQAHNNKLTSIKPSNFSNLTNCYISQNYLTFESILPFVGKAETFYYNPQAEVGQEKQVELPIVLSSEVDMSLDASATDNLTDNSYIWYKDGSVIRDAATGLDGRSFSPNRGGVYYYTITNPDAPELTLRSRLITVLGDNCNTPSSDNKEYLALTSLFNNTNGSQWINNVNWLSNSPLSEWHGISLNESGHITHIYLNDNNLKGSIPQQVADMPCLEVVHLHNNYLENSSASFASIRELKLENNALTFDGVLANIEGPTSYTYAPQAPVGKYLVLAEDCEEGAATLHIEVQDLAPGNTYQWYRKSSPSSEGTPIVGANAASYTATASGIYYYTITNPRAPLLTLQSRPKVISIDKP